MINILPKNWIKITLEDICYSKDGLRRGPFGSAIKKEFFVTDGYKVYEQSNAIYDDVKRGKYYISESKYIELKAFAVQEGDFLVSCSGTLGKITLVPNGAKAGIINQALLRIRTDSTLVNKHFFQYFFRSEGFQRLIFDQSQGTAMNNLIGIKDFKLLEIPLPPPLEQRRIVAKIEELFSELDKGVEMLNTAKLQLKVYRQAVLKYAFEGKLTNPDVKEGELPEGWVLNTISDVCDMKAGFFIKASEISEIKKEGLFPCYGGNGLRGYVKTNTHQGKFPIVGRQGALCGNVHLVDGTFYATEHAVVVTAKENVDTNWLYHKLSYMKLNKYSTGTAQPGLSVNKLLPLSIEIPTIKEQIEIVQEIESRLSVCDKIEQSIEQGLLQAEALRQSILKKAFEGKLVPQDPNDEPASILLERIRAGRVTDFKEKKKNTKKVKA